MARVSETIEVPAALVAREIEEAARRDAFEAAIDEGLASGSSGKTLGDLMAEFRQRHCRS